jgi:hypothetical protein
MCARAIERSVPRGLFIKSITRLPGTEEGKRISEDEQTNYNHSYKFTHMPSCFFFGKSLGLPKGEPNTSILLQVPF